VEFNFEYDRVNVLREKNIKEYYENEIKDGQCLCLGNKNVCVNHKKYSIIPALFAINCVYFKNMFYGSNMERNDKDIVLNNVDNRAFEWFIEYFYGIKPKLNADIVAEVYILSDKWVMKSVKLLCETYIDELQGWNIDRSMKTVDRRKLSHIFATAKATNLTKPPKCRKNSGLYFDTLVIG